jgi:glycogen phosphorylase
MTTELAGTQSDNQTSAIKTNPPVIQHRVAMLEKDILESLNYIQCKSRELATKNDWYMAVAYTVRSRLMKNWIDTLHDLTNKKVKLVGYLSAEFLVGPHLGNAMINLGIYNEVNEATRNLGLNLRELIDIEEEPGLGNGGLGRLAACYLDSLTSLKVPAIGYGIRYEFGLFEQQIRNGWQYEVTDKWLRFGNPWEVARPELTFRVKMAGHTEHYNDDHGESRIRWIAGMEVKGVAYDTPVPGYLNDKINLLRLWKSEAVESFDFEAFNRGDYHKAVDEKVYSENIGKVLYPNDEALAGKTLRLSQQYFFVSCSIQDCLRLLEIRGLSVHDLPDSLALQLNDTHPSIGVAELMRILVDEKQLDWDHAWRITQNTFAYTNHTLLPEALEKWPISLFGSLLPRHLEIIYEINSRFLAEVRNLYPDDSGIIPRVSLIDEEGERYVRMAYLATVGSHIVNGVSDLHAELIKTDLLRDFNNISPGKFIGITNGVTPRRWMKLYSPELSSLISEQIGDRWITHMEDEMIKLEPHADHPAFQMKWRDIKRGYKNELSNRVSRISGIRIDPASMFDIMVKRIHEYKRQQLNIFHIVHLYNRIKKDPGMDIVPRTFIFGGKAAPGYHMAKLIIKLIHSVGDVINNDSDVDGRLKVIFFPDFSVKNSEWVYRSADLSEQISTAGKEASGTGNMKFAMNGALTVGTMDGANIEMMEEVGRENFFLFGLTVEEIHALKKKGYRPMDLYRNDEHLREVIDCLGSGEFSQGDKNLFKPLMDSLLFYDPYFVLQDFSSYIICQQHISDAFTDSAHWTKMSILNAARMGKFSSDRSIREYCEKIWKVSPGR